MTYTLIRSDWEQSGYTIAGHTTSPPVDWSRVDNVTIHYPGGYNYPLPTLNWFTSYIQQMQHYYVGSRGYSIGYNEIVSQAGHVAQTRGEDYRCAANSVNNSTSYAIQVAVSGEEPASAAAISAIRERVAWAQSRAGRKLRITGHREHKPTSCPGAGLWAQVQAGVFDVPYPPIDPTPPPSGADMIPIEPDRRYDTRGNNKPDGTPIPGGSEGPLSPGEIRRIKIAKTSVGSAFIHVTVPATTGNGHLSVSTDGLFSGGTSFLNYNADHVAHDGAPVWLNNGYLYFRAKSDCDFIVDVYAEG